MRPNNLFYIKNMIFEYAFNWKTLPRIKPSHLSEVSCALWEI